MNSSMYFRARRIGARVAGVFAAAVLSGAGMLAGGLPASAGAVSAAPSPPVGVAFDAPPCAGTTVSDPSSSGSALGNDLQVLGARLASYNAGNVVPLYDSYGGALLDAYPPLCGVRYVAGVGPVSEWMYCTDLDALTCGGTDASGNLVDTSSPATPLNPLTDLTGNPRLTANQNAVIGYLIHNGHPYAGVGNQSWNGVTEAANNSTTDGRNALQSLIWCVSDTPSTGSDLAATCAAIMDATEQARIAALTETPSSLTVTPSASSLAVGGTASLTVTTNVFTKPVTVAVTPPVALSVCGGPATLAGSALTVHGTDPTTPVAVTLCFASNAAASYTVSTEIEPVTTADYLVWHQSQRNALAEPCQVFSTFDEDKSRGVAASTVIAFTAAPDETTSTTTSAESTLTSIQAAGTPITATSASTMAAAAGAPSTAVSETTAAVAGHGELASTGPHTALLATTAAVLVVVGFALIITTRGRRKPHRRIHA